MEEVKQKFKDIEDDVNPAQLMAYINVHVMTSQKIMEELDKVFGENFCRKVFRENYELNPDFVPDEIAIAELVDSLVPIMEKHTENVSREHRINIMLENVESIPRRRMN